MLRIQMKTNIDKARAYSAFFQLFYSVFRIYLILDFPLKIVGDTIFTIFLKLSTTKILKFVFLNF